SRTKYRDKSGNVWAGRGALPTWLREKLKAGAKLEAFAVHKAKYGLPTNSRAANQTGHVTHTKLRGVHRSMGTWPRYQPYRPGCGPAAVALGRVAASAIAKARPLARHT